MRNLLVVLLFLPFFAVASNIELAEKFIELTDKTKVKGASKKDIVAVANLLSDQMRYQHPNYNANLSKEQFIEGLVRYMGAADAMSSKIIKKIDGLNAVAITFISITVIDGKVEVDKTPLMRLFEFEQNKIILVKEYW